MQVGERESYLVATGVANGMQHRANLGSRMSADPQQATRSYILQFYLYISDKNATMFTRETRHRCFVSRITGQILHALTFLS
jgi:hypothetical protein